MLEGRPVCVLRTDTFAHDDSEHLLIDSFTPQHGIPMVARTHLGPKQIIPDSISNVDAINTSEPIYCISPDLPQDRYPHQTNISWRHANISSMVRAGKHSQQPFVQLSYPVRNAELKSIYITTHMLCCYAIQHYTKQVKGHFVHSCMRIQYTKLKYTGNVLL